MGPDITIATVLFAVQQSTSNARMEIPNSPPLGPLIRFLITFKINSIPPYSFTKATIAATIMEITVMSYILVIPSPIFWNTSPMAKAPVPTPTIADKIVPAIKTTNTLIPTNAPINTTRYGTTFTIS